MASPVYDGSTVGFSIKSQIEFPNARMGRSCMWPTEPAQSDRPRAGLPTATKTEFLVKVYIDVGLAGSTGLLSAHTGPGTGLDPDLRP